MWRLQYLGAFRFRPSFHRHRADVSHATDAQKNSHHIIILRNFHNHHEIVLSHRVKELHFPAGLLNHPMRFLDSLRRLANTANALLSPVPKNNKTRQNFHLQITQQHLKYKNFTPRRTLSICPLNREAINCTEH